MGKIYLSIAGFNILCRMEESEQTYHRNRFLDMVEKDYGEFVVDKPKKVDFTMIINSTNMTSMEIRENTNNKNVKNHMVCLFHVDEKRHVLSTHNPLGNFDLESIVNQVVYQYLLPHNKGFVLHGSSVRYKDKAFINEGRRGAGKSTTAQLLKGLCEVFSDDSIVVRKYKNRFYAYQPFFHEKNYNFERTNKDYKIEKIFFIRKSKKNYLEEIKNKNLILNKILKQVFTYPDGINIQFPLLTDFVNTADFYYLYVRKDEKEFKKFFKKEILKV